MGILDSVIGEGASGVTKQKMGARESFLGEVSRGAQAESSPFKSLFLDRTRDLEGGRVAQRTAAIGTNVTSVAQRFGGSIRSQGQSQRGDDVGAALNRARGISKIAGATARDFDSRLLRDRIGARKHGLGVKARGQSSIATGLGIRDRVAGANVAAQKDLKSAQSGFVGGIAGMIAGSFGGGGGETLSLEDSGLLSPVVSTARPFVRNASQLRSVGL